VWLVLSPSGEGGIPLGVRRGSGTSGASFGCDDATCHKGAYCLMRFSFPREFGGAWIGTTPDACSPPEPSACIITAMGCPSLTAEIGFSDDNALLRVSFKNEKVVPRSVNTTSAG